MKLVSQIESHLFHVYRIEQDLRVRDFLISDSELQELIPDQDLEKTPRELFLVKNKPEEDTLEIALFLDDDLQRNLTQHDPLQSITPKNISDFCAVIEGVSHFVYYVQKATQNQNVTQLELELQAEVDKYVLLSLFLKSDAGSRQEILDLLFANYYLHSGLNAEQKERYQTASDLARKYCFQLSQNLANLDYTNFLSEVRTFYNFSQTQKIQHILS